MKFLICLSFFLFSQSVFSVTRFKQEQLSFTLFESDGTSQRCKHIPLTNQSPAPPPPWWMVTCGARSYVVDVWVDQRKTQSGLSFDLMFHVKESTNSSGEKRVRFDSHLTSLWFELSGLPIALSSQVDVRNGLADLRVSAKIPQL